MGRCKVKKFLISKVGSYSKSGSKFLIADEISKILSRMAVGDEVELILYREKDSDEEEILMKAKSIK
jgi:hypothetical protein